MIYLDFLDVPESENWVVVDGPYPSVQLTYDLLRDEDGRVIASRFDKGWFRVADEKQYTDIVFRVEAE